MSQSDKSFYQLFKEFIDIDFFNESDKLNEIYKDFRDFYENNKRHSYAEISTCIYYNWDPEDDEDVELLAHKAEYMYELACKHDPDISDNFFKFLDHINLAILQKEFIKNNIKLFENKSDNLENRIKVIQRRLLNKYREAEQKIEELSQNKSKIYSEFTVILGIFSAIVFATFGGLEILENILGNIKEVSTPKLIVFSSFSVIAIVFLLFILLSGIARIIDKNIRSCNCSNSTLCPHSIFTKYPAIVVVCFVLFYTSLIGVFGFITDYEDIFNISNIFKNGVNVIFLLFLILAPIIFIVTFVLKRKKDRKMEKLKLEKDKYVEIITENDHGFFIN